MLYRVHLITESSQETQKQPSSTPNIEREDTESTLTSITMDTESKRKIGLDTQVSAGGANFSSGQRQLIAMVGF